MIGLNAVVHYCYIHIHTFIRAIDFHRRKLSNCHSKNTGRYDLVAILRRDSVFHQTLHARVSTQPIRCSFSEISHKTVKGMAETSAS